MSINRQLLSVFEQQSVYSAEKIESGMARKFNFTHAAAGEENLCEIRGLMMALLCSFNLSVNVCYGRANPRGLAELGPREMHCVAEPCHAWETA